MHFINTTLPYLDDASNASVRSYTTRANFARRRRDRARLLFRARTASSQPGTGRRNELALAPLLARNAHPLTATLSHQEFFLLDYLFRISYPFAFTSTQNESAGIMSDSGDSLAQQSWLDLVFAAPAMTQATMCLAATHYHQRGGGAEYLALACRYNGRAIQAINNTLNDPITRFSDGLVSAVFTLAFSAHLVEDESTWGTHILGAAHIASARLAATQRLLPTWLSDLLFGSFLNYIFRKAHRIESSNAVGTNGLPFFDSFPSEVQFCFADRVFWVNASSLPASRALRSTSFHKALENLLCQQSPVSENPRPSIRALHASLEIFTRLFWPKSSHDHDHDDGHGHEHEHENLGNASFELRQVFQGPNIRLCATVELTLWEFILGYIAAGDLEARRWFARMLVRACRAMQITSWDRAVTVFSAFLYTESFLHACHAVWYEAILPELHPKSFRQSSVAVTVPAQNEEQGYGQSHAM